jgi:Domain of Unknown Function (DUF1080)
MKRIGTSSLVCLVAVVLWLQPFESIAETLSANVSSTASKAKPPRGALVLFEGRNLDAWVSQKAREWEDSDGPADWKITKDGSLEVVPGAGSLITKKRFSDFKLHLKFRLINEKTNGGVFLMARYELGIKNGEGNGNEPQYGCAFENLQKPIRPVAPALKFGPEWQALDVDFRAPRLDASGKTIENARATVLLNGIKIHDNVELGPRKGAAKRLGDAATGPLMLQEHGTAYQFRDIWIFEKSNGGGSPGRAA